MRRIGIPIAYFACLLGLAIVAWIALGPDAREDPDSWFNQEKQTDWFQIDPRPGLRGVECWAWLRGSGTTVTQGGPVCFPMGGTGASGPMWIQIDGRDGQPDVECWIWDGQGSECFVEQG